MRPYSAMTFNNKQLIRLLQITILSNGILIRPIKRAETLPLIMSVKIVVTCVQAARSVILLYPLSMSFFLLLAVNRNACDQVLKSTFGG